MQTLKNNTTSQAVPGQLEPSILKPSAALSLIILDNGPEGCLY